MQMGRKMVLKGDVSVISPRECACCNNGKLYIHTDEVTKVDTYYCKNCFDSSCQKCDSKTFKTE